MSPVLVAPEHPAAERATMNLSDDQIEVLLAKCRASMGPWDGFYGRLTSALIELTNRRKQELRAVRILRELKEGRSRPCAVCCGHDYCNGLKKRLKKIEDEIP